MDDYRVRRIKGDIVEVICKNHFAAMGFQVENAGVEHFATQFANRSARMRDDGADGSNVGKIQNYIGHLPDLLIGHERHDHHFVEAKFRNGISIHAFAKELLWDYRRQIFGREFDSDIFSDITKRQWADSTEAFKIGQASRAHLDVYMKAVTQGGIDPEAIQVPMMFYVVLKDEKKFSLFLIRFDGQEGKFQIHQAGKPKEMISTDIATGEFLGEFDKKFSEVVAPILRDVFSADIDVIELAPAEAKKTVPANSALEVCLNEAMRIKVKSRHGVYFGTLLKAASVSTWLKNANRAVSKEDLKIELEKCGMNSSPLTFTMSDGKEIDLSIREYKIDFDFYMK